MEKLKTLVYNNPYIGGLFLTEEKEDLIALKELLLDKKSSINVYSKYSKIYPHSNEMLFNILKGVDGINKKALTVLSSGDQLYDLILNGYRNIDTFDINKFTDYYALGLKKTAIKYLNLNDYIKFFGVNDNINPEIIKYLLDYMDDKNKCFWNYYLDIIANNIVNEELFFACNTKKVYVNDISFIRNNYNYNLVKENIDNTIINYYNYPIEEITNIKNKYDLIYLSNICEYLSNTTCKSVLKDTYKELLNRNGSIYTIGKCCLNKKMINKSIDVFTDDLWGFTRIVKVNALDVKEELRKVRKVYK